MADGVRARLAGSLLRSGVGLFALGMTTGLGLILHYFYVTPFEICSASFAAMSPPKSGPGPCRCSPQRSCAGACRAGVWFDLAGTP